MTRANRLNEYLLQLSEVYTYMELGGMRLDLAYVQQLEAKLRGEEDQLEAEMVGLVPPGKDKKGKPTYFNPRSFKQVQSALYYGNPYTLPVQVSFDTGKPTTDAAALMVLRESHPDNALLRALLRYRKAQKLRATYVTGWRELADNEGYVHSNMGTYRTVTGRPAASDPNVLNLPSRGKEAKQVKSMVVPDADSSLCARLLEMQYGYRPQGLGWEERGFPDGEPHVLLQVDGSQMELKVIAAASQDPEMMAIFARGGDIHFELAHTLWTGREEEMRREAKIANFSLAYQGSVQVLVDLFWKFLSEDERAERISQAGGKDMALRQVQRTMAELDRAWKQKFAGVVRYQHDIVKLAFEQGYLDTPFGRRRTCAYIPADEQQRAELSRHLVNFRIQSIAVDITQTVMLRMFHWLRENVIPARIMVMVYDSIVYSCHPNWVERVAEKTQQLFTEVGREYIGDSVAITSDAEAGPAWGKLIKLNEWREQHGAETGMVRAW